MSTRTTTSQEDTMINTIPSDVTAYFECEDCGHQQTAVVIHADGAASLIEGIVGSDADYCNLCGEAVEMLALEVRGALYEAGR